MEDMVKVINRYMLTMMTYYAAGFVPTRAVAGSLWKAHLKVTSVKTAIARGLVQPKNC